MTIDFKALTAPFPPEAISWRVGSTNQRRVAADTNNPKAKPTKGMALAYIDARDVMERLDEVCGPGGWQCRYPHAAGKTVCEIGLYLNDTWVWKADGAGDTDHEAEKGALSDAFKRAAVRWGIGRYLYSLSSPWVDLDERGQIVERDRRNLEMMLARLASHALTTPTNTSVHPEGPDWWGAEGDGMSASEAKKQGYGEKMDAWLGEIPNIPTAQKWKEWCAEHSDEIKTLPHGWRVQLREEAEERGIELGALTNERRAA